MVMPRAGVPLGLCFDRRSDPSGIPPLARHLEANGFDDLWVVEDCFYTTGTSLAAAALASSHTLTVGLGLLPAVTRHPALTAMELATLARLAPGRVWAGIGHGVQSWMAQMGLRQTSPVRALDETLRVVRELLAGREISMAGTFAHLDHIQLEDAPALAPPVLAGVRGPVSLAMAGRAADGLLLAEYTGLAGVRSAVAAAGRGDDFPVVTYTATHVDVDRDHARRVAADTVAGVLADPPPSLRDAAYFDEVSATLARHGPAALPGLPDEVWTDLAAVGDPDDLAAHVEGLRSAGAHRIAFAPVDPDAAQEQATLIARSLLDPGR